jgi:hypothetical protein
MVVSNLKHRRAARIVFAAVTVLTEAFIVSPLIPAIALAAEPQVLSGDNYVAEPPQFARAGQGGKYGKLLRIIAAEDDRSEYGDFYDYGYWSGTEYKGDRDLPAGYWVYVAPHWFIFGEPAAKQNGADQVRTVQYIQLQTATAQGQRRPWGPEQAVGPPDTHLAGDIQTAWASQTPDGQDEWLRLHYAKPVVPAAIQVYETFNPGALCRITARKSDGSEVELWSGDDPVKTDAAMGVACIPVKADFATDCITIYLKSTKVPGWNEIDAVGVVDQQNNQQWAASAEASSTYADVVSAAENSTVSSTEARIADLEARVRQLTDEVEALKQKLDQRRDR